MTSRYWAAVNSQSEAISSTDMSQQPDLLFNEVIPLSTDTVLRGDLTNLSARERMTYEELSRLDPQLAGLYRLGHELAARLSEPGAQYILAHVGRELGRGVVRALAGEDTSASGINGADIQENERNRATIGAVLQLPLSHGLVTTWFQLNRIFSESAHYRAPGPSADEIRSAFLGFSELLFGRVAPYFATHAELDQFLNVESPAVTDIERIRALLVRPQQRRYFFTHLQHPAWLVSLEEAGYFETPPDRIVEPDGRWRMQGWSEGEYLARIASVRPERVTEILLRIPPDIQNPAVWTIVIDAAKVMPAAYAVRLVELLEQAFRATPPVLFPRHTIDLVIALAKQGEVAAFRLAECLLWLSRDPQEGNDAQYNAMSRRPRGRYDTEWMLERLEVYELSEFCNKALPALETLDPLRAVKLFTKQLKRSIWLGQRAEGAEAHLVPDHGWWCPYLDRYETVDDVRAILAVALTGLAKRTIQRDTSIAEPVIKLLQDQTSGIFTRIRYAVLESAGPFVQHELDSVIASGELLDRPFGAREAAALLRKQFANASPDAKRFFRYALEQGPTAEEVKHTIINRRDYESTRIEMTDSTHAPISESEIGEVVAAWQRRRLGWFHDCIPTELQPLAERLGITPQIPSLEDQELDEVGFYTGGVTAWAGDQSPKTVQEIGLMSVANILEFLTSWEPDRETIDGPSYRGLENALTSVASENPDNATQLIARGLQTSISPGYFSALLTGLCNAAEAGKPISWEDVLPMALAVVQASEISILSAAGEQNDSMVSKARHRTHNTGQWSSVARALANLIRVGCAKDIIPNTLADDVWAYTEAAVRSPVLLADTYNSTEEDSLDKILMAAYNTTGGDTMRMLIDVALWRYRHLKRVIPSNMKQPIIQEIAVHLTPLLDHVLAQQGPASLGALAILGHFIPQIYLLVPEWASAAEERLFTRGAEDPLCNPIWGAYVTRSHFYDSTFRRLRQWYVHAAEAAGHYRNVTGRDTLTKGLAVHVIIGVIRGLCKTGDEDALVEKTFSNLPLEDRSHAYWSVFRGWSDAKEPMSIEAAHRIVRFWEWRISDIERSSDTPERAKEADGLIWFLITPYIPVADAIRLGLRTIRLNTGERHTRGGVWERLKELAEFDPAGAFELTDLLIEQEFSADYAYLPYEHIAPALRATLSCDVPEVRTRAKRLIHSLGERGYLQFGNLLSGDQS